MTALSSSTAGNWKDQLLGYQFPPGALHVLPYEDWLARDCIGALPAQGKALHPAWTLIGALRGMGLTLSELFAVIGAADDDGVMFGETEIDQYEPLEVERHYAISGRFVDVQRRRGRKLGTFDLVTFELTIEHHDGPVARCRNSFVVPRRDKS
ncbi:hypothetical protein [Rhodococcus koreensis]|uniref:hypothetical protein n=1 Tax=Rhodococcus koreensis TaxID=99653 RepID=UPI00366B43C4